MVRECVACGCVFRGMAPASDAAKKIPWVCGPGEERIGAPSVGLSLGGLHACRAHLRFTRQAQAIAAGNCFARAETCDMRIGSGRPEGSSEGFPFFGLDKGVHLSVHIHAEQLLYSADFQCVSAE